MIDAMRDQLLGFEARLKQIESYLLLKDEHWADEPDIGKAPPPEGVPLDDDGEPMFNRHGLPLSEDEAKIEMERRRKEAGVAVAEDESDEDPANPGSKPVGANTSLVEMRARGDDGRFN